MKRIILSICIAALVTPALPAQVAGWSPGQSYTSGGGSQKRCTNSGKPLKDFQISPVFGSPRFCHPCAARGPHQFRDPEREHQLIREAFGDAPLVGFFANGEISNDRLYGYTGVLTLFF